MKRSRFSRWMVLLTLASMLLLAYLAKLQWDWLDAFENTERVRAERSLSRNGFNLKVAVDREFHTLARCFEGLGGSLEQLEAQIADRRQRWFESSRWPELLDEVYMLSGTAEQPHLARFDAHSGRFEAAAWSVHFAPLHDVARSLHLRPAALRVDTALPAVVVAAPLIGSLSSETSLREPPGAQTAQLVLKLDQEYWGATFFPELVSIFFPPPNFEGVGVAVVRSGQQDIIYSTSDIRTLAEFGRSDFALGLLDAGTDGDELPRIGMRPPKGQEAMPNWNRPPTEDDHTWFRHLWADTYYSGYWHLHLAVGGQSIADRVREARWQALMRAFGVLLLIGVVIGLVIWLARTAQRTARQQIDFIAGVSHEFRTPLAVLSAAGDNLADSLVRNPEQLQEYGRVIQDESLRLREMVENVLHMARQSSPTGQPTLRPIQATQLVEDTLARLSRVLEKEAFDVEVELPQEPLHILGDLQALQSALVNLISNGLKYGRLARWLRVSVSKGRNQGRDEVHIAVEDRGDGIEAEELRRIFEPFFRGRRAREEHIDGSGLGLALVHDVATSHRGRVSVETHLGRGSRFTLHLPFLDTP